MEMDCRTSCFSLRAVLRAGFCCAVALVCGGLQAEDFPIVRDGAGAAEVLGSLFKCEGDGVEEAERAFLAAVKERTGVELKRVVQWQYEQKRTGKGKIIFGKGRLPGTKKGPSVLWRDEPYQKLLMQIAGTHGFAVRRDTEFTDRLYVFADTGEGLLAAAKALAAECLVSAKAADGKPEWQLALGSGERVWSGAKYEVAVDPDLSAVVERGVRIHDLVGLKGKKAEPAADFEIPVEAFARYAKKLPEAMRFGSSRTVRVRPLLNT